MSICKRTKVHCAYIFFFPQINIQFSINNFEQVGMAIGGWGGSFCLPAPESQTLPRPKNRQGQKIALRSRPTPENSLK